MKTSIMIILTIATIDALVSHHAYARHVPNQAIGVVLGAVGGCSLKTNQGQLGISSNVVLAIFNLSVENNSAIFAPDGVDHLTLTYVGVGYFQVFQVQGERYSVRIRSDITLFNNESPGFSDPFDRWAIIRKGVVLTAIVDKSWRDTRPGWTIAVGIGVCL